MEWFRIEDIPFSCVFKCSYTESVKIEHVSNCSIVCSLAALDSGYFPLLQLNSTINII